MAQQLGYVVARDLPLGPSWLLPDSDAGAPNEAYDTAWCGNCHAPEYQAWQESAHAHASADVMVKYGLGVEQALRGPQYSRQCGGCHDPVSVRMGDASFTSGRGITCLGCHDVTRLIRAGGNSDFEATVHDWTKEHLERAAASLATLRTPDFCATCHQQFVPGNGIAAISTLSEWQGSSYAAGHALQADDGGTGPLRAGQRLASSGAASGTTPCVGCHMSDHGTGLHDHAFPGGNVYVAQQFNEPDFVTTVTQRLEVGDHAARVLGERRGPRPGAQLGGRPLVPHRGDGHP